MKIKKQQRSIAITNDQTGICDTPECKAAMGLMDCFLERVIPLLEKERSWKVKIVLKEYL